MKARLFFMLILLSALSVCSTASAQPPPTSEEVTLTTYYPAPYGDYVELTVSGNAASPALDITPTLTAAANNDILTALNINPTFNDLGWFNVRHNGLIVQNGNVGIGTTAPNAGFHLRDPAWDTDVYIGNPPQTVHGHVSSEASGIFVASDTNYGPAGGFGGHVFFINKETAKTWHIGVGNDDSLRITETAIATSINCSPGGNVGIGTTTPSERLDVNGNVNISGDLAAAGTLHSFAANGYQQLPSGLIIQWGCYTTTTDDNQSFTFPIAFPNACFNVQTTPNGNASAYPTRVVSTTVSGFTANRHNSLDGNSDFYWFAIGH